MEEREKNRLKQRNLIKGKERKLVRPVEGELTKFKKTNKSACVKLELKIRTEYIVSQIAKGWFSLDSVCCDWKYQITTSNRYQ